MDNISAPASDGRWADLADLVLNIAREVQTQGHQDDRVIRLAASERNVMRFVDRNPDSTATEVAEGTGVQRSNLSTTLRLLEEKGLVQKCENSQDGRGVRLHPTDLAAKNLRLLRQHWDTLMSTAADGDPTLLRDTIALLSRIETGLIHNRQSTSRPSADH